MLLVFFAAGVGCGGGSSNAWWFYDKLAERPREPTTVTVTATSGSHVHTQASHSSQCISMDCAVVGRDNAASSRTQN